MRLVGLSREGAMPSDSAAFDTVLHVKLSGYGYIYIYSSLLNTFFNRAWHSQVRWLFKPFRWIDTSSHSSGVLVSEESAQLA
jgi:hypothetical protein